MYRNSYFVKIIFLFLSLMVSPLISANNNLCAITKEVRVEGTELITEESLYRKVRSKLLDELLIEAVERVNGVEKMVRKFNQVEFNNEKLYLRSKEKNIGKTQGLVQSYSFLHNGEEIVEGDFGIRLTLRLDVIVCDQSNLEGKIYVAIGDIDFKNFEQYLVDELPEIVASGIPPDSNIYTVSYPASDDSYYDYLVTGKILSIAVTREVSAFRSALGNIVSANGRPIVDSQVNRLSSVIVLKAVNTFDGSYIIVNETIEKKVGATPYKETLAQHVDEFITESLGEASKKLFVKIRDQKDFKKSRF